jgi:hypothetical protein
MLEITLPETPPPASSTIAGTVVDAHTGEPLPGASVRLDLSHADEIDATTAEGGAYALAIPEVPEFFAISASLEGYIPASANIAAELVRDRSLTVHFRLRRSDLSTVAIEAVPDVHHLGDDRFTGSVNSRFQKSSEGATFTATFELSELQIAPYMTQAEITMLIRGVQMRHPVYINGQRTRVRLSDSPGDGSFGEFRARFDVEHLRAGENTLEIRAKSRSGDIDDFEFVNVQLNLTP